MRTTRFSGRLGAGGGVSALGGVCLVAGVSRGCLPRVCVSSGVSAWRGVSAQWVYIPLNPEADTPLPIAYWDTPPPLNRMTDRRKNITLGQTSFADDKYIETK